MCTSALHDVMVQITGVIRGLFSQNEGIEIFDGLIFQCELRTGKYPFASISNLSLCNRKFLQCNFRCASCIFEQTAWLMVLKILFKRVLNKCDKNGFHYFMLHHYSIHTMYLHCTQHTRFHTLWGMKAMQYIFLVERSNCFKFGVYLKNSCSY